jgi:hypothetical protein
MTEPPNLSLSNALCYLLRSQAIPPREKLLLHLEMKDLMRFTAYALIYDFYEDQKLLKIITLYCALLEVGRKAISVQKIANRRYPLTWL